MVKMGPLFMHIFVASLFFKANTQPFQERVFSRSSMGSRLKTRPRSSSQRAPDRMPDLLLPSSDQQMSDTARQMQEINDRRAAIAEESRRLDEKASRVFHGL